MKKSFAFWPHDQFPYCLGAPVESIKNGLMTLTGYGNYKFERTASTVLVPLQVGQKLDAELEEVTKDYQIALQDLKKEYASRALKAFQQAKVALPNTDLVEVIVDI